MVCLYFEEFILICLHNFVIWQVEVAHFKTYVSCLPGDSVSYKQSVFNQASRVTRLHINSP